LLGARNPTSHELRVEVRALKGKKADGSVGVGLLLALCSALLEKPLRGGLVIVGELEGDRVKPMQQATGILEAAIRAGARALLVPVSSRPALAEVSDDIATQIDVLFYANVMDALARALHE
jgi:ATP-dependent Lon protease